MKEDNDKQNITIRFGSWDLPMTVQRKNEHLYREAEKIMKERYAFYTTTYKGLATERYMIMSMLDIAVRLAHAQEKGDPAPFVSALQPLVDEIETLLGERK